MSAREEQLVEANWKRIRIALDAAALEFRRTAEALEQIGFEDSKGRRRTPESIISEVALSMHTSAPADVIHRLAIWADAIREIELHQSGEPK